MSASDSFLDQAYRTIADRIGHVVPHLYAERVAQGLSRAQSVLRASSPQSALSQLYVLPVACPAWQALIQGVTIGETNFYRHPEWFSEITRLALEPLIEERRLHGPKRIDLWSAGCSTGEEAYTLAMIVRGLLPAHEDFTVRIVATDINEASLARARAATYRAWSLRELDPDTISRSFVQIEPGSFRLSSHLRTMVDFKVLNLCGGDYPSLAEGFAGFDLIICRNVLIYFEGKDQLAVASRLRRSLAPGGWLAVSPAEATADWYKPLRMVSRNAAILFHNPDPSKDHAAAAKHRPDKGAPSSPARVANSWHASKRPSDRRAAAKAAPRHAPPARTAPTTSAARSHLSVSAPKTAAPSKPGAHDPVGHARGLADRGAYDEARQACETHLASAGPNFGAYLLLAIITLETGELQVAFDAARCATYLDPDSAAAHYLLGMIHHRMGSQQLASRKMAVVMTLLQQQPAEEPVSEHFGASVAELRESVRAYLAELTET